MAFDEVETAFGSIELDSLKSVGMTAGVVVLGAAGTAGAWAVGNNLAQNSLSAVASTVGIDLAGNSEDNSVEGV